MSIKITQISTQETWALRSRVMWPNKPLEFVMLKEDAEGIHFGLWNESKLISVVSLFVKNDSAQFRKLATETSEQGKGYGTLLVKHLIAYASHLKIKKMWCNARADKTGFYKKFGMQKTRKAFCKENIEFIIMEKTISK